MEVSRESSYEVKIKFTHRYGQLGIHHGKGVNVMCIQTQK